MGQAMVNVMRAATSFAHRRTLRWHVVAALDLPKAFDVSKRVKVNVA